ncbi:MAG: RIP metalloprotease RseP [Alphaproteobacteria bacterium]|nr:RIP metalloprotease RseP [Alphaproteobacteria bacterium]
MFQFSLAAIGFSIFAYFVALIVIVFIHEYGHFQVGRWCGVKIETFSVGFGREIFGFNDKYGTRWKFCWIPLGGYVRFKGDANAASMPSSDARYEPDTLHAAAVWKRALIVAAGPFANFILAIFIFAAAFMFVGTPINEPRVDSVTETGAAKAAGILPGDFIRVIDGKAIHSFLDIREAMILQGDTPVQIRVERNKQMLDIKIVPKVIEETDDSGRKQRTSQIGIIHEFSKDPVGVERLGPLAAVAKGVERTWFVSATTLRYVGKMFTGKEKSDQLHGPIGVAQMAGESASLGIWPFITFIALISVSIGLVNLFPIPMLDGGHLVFYLIEAVFGKPVGPVAQEWSFRIGLSAMLALMLFATNNDISPYVSKVFGW